MTVPKDELEFEDTQNTGFKKSQEVSTHHESVLCPD
jgi:hypothetical protein